MTNYQVPSYYNESEVEKLYLPRYDQIIQEAVEFRKKHNVPAASTDRKRVAMFAIDAQVGFCTPGASLYVPNAEKDVAKAIDFIYKNIDKITELHFSLDTHYAFQIFHPTFWIDNEGNHPAPFTIIKLDDIRNGKWMPSTHPKHAEDYVRQLEAQGKYDLCIWPFHTMLGSLDHALVPALFEASLFHTIVRKTSTKFETKGQHPLTENYSVMAPEVKQLLQGTKDETTVGQFNTKFFRALMNNDQVIIWGEAASHCVKATIEDLISQIQSVDPSLIDKIVVFKDCMSPVIHPVIDFPAIAQKALEDFEKAGVKVVNSTDFMF